MRTLFVLTALAGLPAVAVAQEVPANGEFEPLPCGRQPMSDGVADEVDAIAERDLVGDRDRPAGLRAVDDDFLYLRLRLEDDAIPGGTIQPFYWGFEIDTDDDRGDYELLFLVDGVNGNVHVFRNTTTDRRDDPTDPADTPAVKTYPIATHATSIAAGSSFGDDDDFFLTMALPWADLEALGLERDTPVYVWAASSESPNALDGDFACHDGRGGPPGLGDVDGDHTVLDPDVDSDGDGHSDADEVEGGSDPDDPNSQPGGGGSGEDAFAGGGGCSVAGSDGAWLVCLVLFGLRRRRQAGGSSRSSSMRL